MPEDIDSAERREDATRSARANGWMDIGGEIIALLLNTV